MKSSAIFAEAVPEAAVWSPEEAGVVIVRVVVRQRHQLPPAVGVVVVMRQRFQGGRSLMLRSQLSRLLTPPGRNARWVTPLS